MLNYTELGKDVYIVRENTVRVNSLNSILIENAQDSQAILIDTNFTFQFVDDLYARIKSPARALIFSHCHTDHMASGFYHQEKHGTPLYCPFQEKDNLLSLEALMENSGFKALGLADTFKMFVERYIKFKEAKQVNTFDPGRDTLSYETVEIETIHIPGHSPGHTAFLIRSTIHDDNRKILFVSDIGSHPYYGDLNCSLKDYFDSIEKLEKIYLSDDHVLVPAHGTVYLKKDDDFFNRIRERIRNNEKKVFHALSKKNEKSIKEIVLEGIFTPLEKQNPYIKDLYLLWDGGMIHQHLLKFIERGLAKKVANKDFLNDKYILI